MHHRRQVFVDLHAGLQQRAPFGLGGQAHGVGIDVLARHQDAHGHAALARRDQCLVDQLVRHEIRGLQVDGMLGRGNAHQVHQVHALAAAGGRGDEQVRVHVAHALQRREVALAIQHLAGGLDPVVVEGGLKLRHHRAFDLEMHVAPMVGVLCVAGPLLGHAHTAGEGDAPVHHQQLAVGAVVHAAQVVPVQGAVALHLRAGVLHQVDEFGFHLQAAHPVEQHRHLHASLGALGQCLGQFLADVARPVDVGLEGDGLLRRADGAQHGGEDLVAVLQIEHAVAADDGGAEHHAHLAPVLRVADGVVVLDLAVELLLGRGEVHRQHHGQHGHKRGDGDRPEHLLLS